MKNNLWKTALLTATVIAALFALFYLPRTSVAGIDLRRVNILSDIQHRDSTGNIIAEIVQDSIDGHVEEKLDVAKVTVAQMNFDYVDSIPQGMVAIEDFADTEGHNREMDKFYRALNQAGSRPVRIAYYGDSYVEGDILTMDLRAMLQQRFGGHGPGFVEVNCVSSDFRRTVRTKRSGWSSYHANEKKGFNSTYQGMAGSYFIPSGNASMELKGQRSVYPDLLDSVDVATVYFTPNSGMSIDCTVNGSSSSTLFADNTEVETQTPSVEYIQEIDTTITDSVVYRQVAVTKSAKTHSQNGAGNIVARSTSGNGRIGSIRVNVSRGNGSRFYGVALDGRKGIVVDNFSMRGSGGQFIGTIPSETMSSFAAVRPYDLIIIHYGLNVASPKTKDYSSYTAQIGKAIAKLKTAYPNAAILVVSIGDRDAKGNDGKMHTMGGVKEMVSFQRKMASDSHVAFWNLYDAMGGDGSIALMKEKKQANLDYTHINFAGGKYIASLLYDVLINGKENYDNRTVSHN